MKKVMVYAYTHFNLGDDLFIKMLCERYPHTIFVLYAPGKYRETFQDLNNITVIASDSPIQKGINFTSRALKNPHFSRLKIAKSCDLAVHIGGSLFIQNGNWQEQLKDTKAKRIKNKPFFLIGANFGPFTDEQYYAEHREVFKNYTAISFREKHSYDLFQELPQVQMAADVVFGLQPDEQQTNESLVIISVIKPSIRDDLTVFDDIYYEKLKEISIHLIEKGYDVMLMSFCSYEQDDEAIDEIIARVPHHYLAKIQRHYYKTNIDETLNLLASARFIIATRFHAMILGWVYRKPVFPIVYSKKMTNVMEDIGFDGSYTTFEGLHALDRKMVAKSMTTNTIDVSEQAKNAEKHFDELDKYLL